MSRWQQELIALGIWSIPAAGLVVLSLFVLGGGSAAGSSDEATSADRGSDAHLELGSKEVRKDDVVPLSQVIRSEAVTAPEPEQPVTNPVEALLTPVQSLATQELKARTEQYQRIASEKNVRIRLMPERFDPRTLGEVIMFELNNQKVALFDRRGRIDELPSNYWVRVNASSVPPEVMQHAMETYSPGMLGQTCLVLSQQVVLQMYRSLYEYLASDGKRDLQRDCEYIAAIRQSPIDPNEFNFHWRVGTQSLKVRERN